MGPTETAPAPPAEPVRPVWYCVFLQKCSANVTAEHHMWSFVCEAFHKRVFLFTYTCIFTKATLSFFSLPCRSQTFNLIIALVADIHIFTFQRPCFSINVFAFSF